MIIEQLYDALIEGGTSPDKAREAARAVADYDARIHNVERDLSVIKWMVGTNIAISLGLVWLVLQLFARLP